MNVVIIDDDQLVALSLQTYSKPATTYRYPPQEAVELMRSDCTKNINRMFYSWTSAWRT